jgi:hypothetical protein
VAVYSLPEIEINRRYFKLFIYFQARIMAVINAATKTPSTESA